MNDSGEMNPDPVVERAAELMRAQSYARPAARLALLDRLADPASRTTTRPAPPRRPVRWGVLAGTLLAAGITIAVVGPRVRPVQHRGASAVLAANDAAARVVHFSIDAPDAQRVMLVGEFNDWSDSATPMERSASGQWTASLALEPGRHLYSFDVGAGRLIPDPSAPSAPEEFFGVRHSVVVVP